MSDVVIRPISYEKDKKQIGRIWREVGWIDEDEDEKYLESFLTNSYAVGAEIRGEVEVSVTGAPGYTQYLDKPMSMWGIMSVTVSRVARKQGLAAELTAACLAEGAKRGATVSMLGMFEQGFYNRFGFGTGSYERFLSFDPASLRVPGPSRPPERIGIDDYKAVHAGLIAASRHHGACWFPEEGLIRSEMGWTKDGFGLGYFNEDRSMVTHHLWFKPEGEHGPYDIPWYSFRDDKEFLELLGIVKSLGDQIHAVDMQEPPGIMLQDYIAKPFKQRRQTRKGAFESRHSAAAYWQIRILDLVEAIGRCSGPIDIDLSLELVDPVGEFLSSTDKWSGIGGSWDIHLGEESRARRGAGRGAVVKTDVGSLSRLWFGSSSARSLALQGALEADEDTIRALDRYFQLPEPHPWWDF